jgi:hypothetical protein
MTEWKYARILRMLLEPTVEGLIRDLGGDLSKFVHRPCRSFAFLVLRPKQVSTILGVEIQNLHILQ